MVVVKFLNRVNSLIDKKGLEVNFAQNVASRWLITNNLSSSFSQTSIINVLGAGNGSPINTKDMELESGFSVMTALNQHASINDVLTVEWSKRIDSSKGKFYHVFPGAVNTNVMANGGFPWIIRMVTKVFLPLLAKSPEKAAKLLLNIPANNPSGSLIGQSGKKLALLPCLKEDSSLGAQVWDYLEKACHCNK